MYKIFLILLLAIVSLSSREYQLGEGYNIPSTPLYIGGYATLDYLQRQDNYNRFRVDELALLSYAQVDNLGYMADIQMKESYIKEWGKRESDYSSDEVSIERLYLNYTLNDVITLRLGKYNTPVGYWNMEPIAIFQASSSQPYLPFLLYPNYATALEISYANPLYSDTTYTLSLQENRDLDERYNNFEVQSHYLVGFEHGFSENLHVKINLGYFRTIDALEFYYQLLALKYESDTFEITAELGRRTSIYTTPVPYSFYLQGVYNIDEKSGIVSRFESYKVDEGAFRQERLGVLGYRFEPIAPLTFKIEYRLHSYKNESQIRTSLSVMF